MKRIVYAPAALASLQDILEWTIGAFGDAQAQKYTDRLAKRLNRLLLVNRHIRSPATCCFRADAM